MLPHRLGFATLVAIVLAPLTMARAEQTNAPSAPATAVAVRVVASGLQNPWGLQFLPDGRLIVTERAGRLRLVTQEGKLSAPITGLPPILVLGQGGLLDLLLAPDFARSGVIYFSFA
jgi:glucose/arabinose dehydrogenase